MISDENLDHEKGNMKTDSKCYVVYCENCGITDAVRGSTDATEFHGSHNTLSIKVPESTYTSVKRSKIGRNGNCTHDKIQLIQSDGKNSGGEFTEHYICCSCSQLGFINGDVDNPRQDWDRIGTLFRGYNKAFNPCKD